MTYETASSSSAQRRLNQKRAQSPSSVPDEFKTQIQNYLSLYRQKVKQLEQTVACLQEENSQLHSDLEDSLARELQQSQGFAGLGEQSRRQL